MAYHPGARTTCEFTRLRALGYLGAMQDMELAWLKNNGATSNDLGDAWMQFLATAGFATGSRTDRSLAYLRSLGLAAIAGDTLADMWREYWCGSYGPT